MECSTIGITRTQCGWSSLGDSIGGDYATSLFTKLSPRRRFVLDGILDSSLYLCHLWSHGFLVSRPIASMYIHHPNYRGHGGSRILLTSLIHFSWHRGVLLVGKKMTFNAS